jgi:hypothetical protein
MNLGLAIFASVVLVLAVYHKQFRTVLLYAIAVGAVLGAIGFGGVYLYDRREAAKYEAHRLAVNDCIDRNKNVDIFDQLVDLKGKSLEERCELDPQFEIVAVESTPSTTSTTPGTISIYGGETLRIVKPNVAAIKGKVPDFVALVPLLYLGHDQKFTVTCGNYNEKNNPAPNPVIEGTTITCK